MEGLNFLAPGNANLLIGDLKVATHEIGVPGTTKLFAESRLSRVGLCAFYFQRNPIFRNNVNHRK